MSEPVKYARPGFFMRSVVGSLMVRSGFVPVLTVVGRSSGQYRRVPLGAPVEVDGNRYLISALSLIHI